MQIFSLCVLFILPILGPLGTQVTANLFTEIYGLCQSRRFFLLLAAAGLDYYIRKTERWVTPEGEEVPEEPTKPTTPVLPPETDKKTIEALAKEVIAGKWGNGTERKERLTAAGYDYKEVKNKVNELLK